jgi:hypothetical protein
MSSERSGSWGPRHGPDDARRREPVPAKRVANHQGMEVLEHLAGGLYRAKTLRMSAELVFTWS